MERNPVAYTQFNVTKEPNLAIETLFEFDVIAHNTGRLFAL